MVKDYYSSNEDCASLAIELNNKLMSKIEFCGSIWQGEILGKYHAIDLNHYEKHRDYLKDAIPFRIKYHKNGFLQLTLSNNDKLSNGFKLAVLSGFCEVLEEYIGKPSLFYIYKNANNLYYNMEWVNNNIDNVLDSIRKSCSLENFTIEELIIFKNTDDEIFKAFHLPKEMLPLIEDNFDDFKNVKKGIPVKKEKRGSKIWKIKALMN